MEQYVLGVDLSGPANLDDSVAVGYRIADGTLVPAEMELHAAEDCQIREGVEALLDRGPVTAGIDAPLSYNPGGDRPGDRKLRARLKDEDLRPCAAVITPTMVRMVYLTLRGVALSRMLEGLQSEELCIVEVHPGAFMALSGVPEKVLRATMTDDALEDLAEYLRTMNVTIDSRVQSRHHLDAIACAAAARDFKLGRSRWVHPADPPAHPYDFAC